MGNNAHNFVYGMKATWGCFGNDGVVRQTMKEENAVTRAGWLGADRIRDYPESNDDHYCEVPGDLPCGLWKFRDGSMVIIGDDGSMVRAVNKPGSRPR